MATEDAHQAAEFWQKLNAMVIAAADAKKKYAAAHARVLAATALLEEECAAAVLIEEARATVALIEPPSPTPPLAPAGRSAPSHDNYKAAIITNIHV
jgi:hypothetical protein